MTTENTINLRLASARISLKLTQGEAGQAIGMKRAAISKIENGKQDVPAELLVYYNKIHNVSAEWLLTGEGPMLKNSNLDNALASQYQEGFSNILLVDTKSQELYTSHFNDQNFLKGLNSFSIPHSKFKVGKFRAFEAAKTVSVPSILEGAIVIGKLVSKFQHGALHIFITKNSIQFRIIQTKGGDIKWNKDEILLEPISGENSNEDRLEKSNILEIWEVEAIITFPSPTISIDTNQLFRPKANRTIVIDIQREVEEQKKRIEMQGKEMLELRREFDKYSKLLTSKDINLENPIGDKKGETKARRKDEETDKL